MEDKELLKIWKSYDQKLEEVLILNKEIAYEVTKGKLHKTINSLRLPKSILLGIGIPYTIILGFITWITFKTGAFIMMLGFGIISLIMIGIIIGYFYHLFLISKINHEETISEVQKRIAELKISSFNITRLAVIQLPFWSLCWVSIEALKNSPLVYGGINLAIFLGLTHISYWLYQNLSIDNTMSKVSKIVFSGNEWEPILKSADILKQLEEYETCS